MEHFSYNGGCGACIIRHIKEYLTWALDKQLQVILNSYTTKELKNKAVLCKFKTMFVTGFERTRLPRTQQEDTLFTITR